MGTEADVDDPLSASGRSTSRRKGASFLSGTRRAKEAAVALDTQGLFRTVDRMDAAGFASFFTEDGTFRFGNAPQAKGRSEIEGAVSEFFGSLKALRHRLVDEWSEGLTQISEVEVTYTRLDDSTVDLMAACIFRRSGDLVADYRIYMDLAPLFSEA
jgi:hypothetical protein